MGAMKTVRIFWPSLSTMGRSSRWSGRSDSDALSPGALLALGGLQNRSTRLTLSMNRVEYGADQNPTRVS
jgi:hypothetical protein